MKAALVHIEELEKSLAAANVELADLRQRVRLPFHRCMFDGSRCFTCSAQG